MSAICQRKMSVSALLCGRSQGRIAKILPRRTESFLIFPSRSGVFDFVEVLTTDSAPGKRESPNRRYQAECERKKEHG